MRRRLAVSISALLVVVSGLSCWMVSNVWRFGSFHIQEPRFPALVVETIALGLAAMLGIFGLIIFWRRAE